MHVTTTLAIHFECSIDDKNGRQRVIKELRSTMKTCGLIVSIKSSKNILFVRYCFVESAAKALVQLKDILGGISGLKINSIDWAKKNSHHDSSFLSDSTFDYIKRELEYARGLSEHHKRFYELLLGFQCLMNVQEQENDKVELLLKWIHFYYVLSGDKEKNPQINDQQLIQDLSTEENRAITGLWRIIDVVDKCQALLTNDERPNTSRIKIYDISKPEVFKDLVRLMYQGCIQLINGHGGRNAEIKRDVVIHKKSYVQLMEKLSQETMEKLTFNMLSSDVPTTNLLVPSASRDEEATTNRKRGLSDMCSYSLHDSKRCKHELGEARKEVAIAQEQAAGFKEQLSQTKGDLANAREQLNQARKEAAIAQEQATGFEEQLSQAKGDLANAREQLNQARKEAAIEQAAGFEEQLSQAKGDLANAREQLNQANKNMQKIQDEKATLQKENAMLKNIAKTCQSNQSALITALRKTMKNNEVHLKNNEAVLKDILEQQVNQISIPRKVMKIDGRDMAFVE